MRDYIERVKLENDEELRLYVDPTPTNPRTEYDHLGKIYHWHRNYDFGTRIGFRDQPEDGGGLCLPLFMYEHGGIAFSLGAFGDRFDSGQVGWIVATRDEILARFDVKYLTRKVLERATEAIKAELQEYEHYVNGNGYGYEIVKLTRCVHCRHTSEEVVDMCSGFLGDADKVLKDIIADNGLVLA